MVEKSSISVLHLGAGRYAPGDVRHSTFDIWKELAKGFRRYTVVGRSKQSVCASFMQDGVDVRLLGSRTTSEAEFLYTQFKAIQIAREISPDAIVAQCPVQGGLAAAHIARHSGARVLMEFHMAHYFEEKSFFSRNGLLEQLTRINLPNAHRIRVLSEGMRIKLLEMYGSQYADRIVVLPPRVDLSRFVKAKMDWKITGRPKVVIVGSVSARKGQLRFLQSILSSRLDLETWIVGTGPDLDTCKAFVASLGADERVKFYGQLNHTELAELLPKADAMVLFSNMEGTPRAIMEAMAIGLPIVTTNAGFCADIVENGVQGFVLGDRPMEEIVGKLDVLFSDDCMRKKMGIAARQRAINEFDSVKLYERYRALIRETAKV